MVRVDSTMPSINENPVKPVVSVLLTHHLDENRPYLDLAIESLATQEGIEFECLLMCDSESVPDYNYSWLRIIHDPTLNTATKKVHYAVNHVHPDSKYFFFMGDDVVLASHTLSELVAGTKDCWLISNPLSNNENGHLYALDLPIKTTKGESVGNSCSLEDFKGQCFHHAFMAFSRYPSILIQTQFVSFYATLIPRVVWEKVGLLDERLEVRHNDQDYCYRALQQGVQIAVNTGAFALHFGSKTLSKTRTEEESKKATEIFLEKWTQPQIVIPEGKDVVCQAV
jgi:hypothetical protein